METSLNWLTEDAKQTLENGYLGPEETPEGMYRRLARAASSSLKKPELETYFYEALTKNWLCPASPVLSNLGTSRGLPISCYGLSVPDSVYGIYSSATEMAMMSRGGGGVGVGLTHIRGRGASIRGNGTSEGIGYWAKLYDVTVSSVSQGSTRRGAGSINLNANHVDIHEFLRIRRPSGDINRIISMLNHCVQINDDFMQSLDEGHLGNQAIWKELLLARLETGEPYIMFEDTVNRANPAGYGKVDMTNICSEITLHTDDEHSFVCCLSSLNLFYYDDWVNYRFANGMSLPELSVWFLDGVLEEFITKAKGVQGLERAVASAIKGRALGLGVLGWHSYLQAHSLPFDTSVEVMGLNSRIFKFINTEADKASYALGRAYGFPEWSEARRNTHLTALAPTATNSIISSRVSPSIEPIDANAFSHKTAKGVFIYKNPLLERELDKIGKNKSEVWKSIVAREGSVQHLDFLPEDTKKVYLTAREINPYTMLRQAAARQPYIDQSQSLNLFFPQVTDDADKFARFFHNVHMEAWRLGIKTLYYCRSTSVLQGDVASRLWNDECMACEG